MAANRNSAQAAAKIVASAKAKDIAKKGIAKGKPSGFRLSAAFTHFAQSIAHFTGRPSAFVGACILIIAWAASGPVFGFSDTWQLVINTSTTIVTFLMVFLIQNTQNRDTMALQIKLSELIIVMKGASNKIATAEDLSEEELQTLHRHYCQAAEHALVTLETKRSHSGKSSR